MKNKSKLAIKSTILGMYITVVIIDVTVVITYITVVITCILKTFVFETTFLYIRKIK